MCSKNETAVDPHERVLDREKGQLGSQQIGRQLSASGILLQKARMKQQESDALFKIGHQMQQLERAGEQKTKADQELLEALMTLLR